MPHKRFDEKVIVKYYPLYNINLGEKWGKRHIQAAAYNGGLIVNGLMRYSCSWVMLECWTDFEERLSSSRGFQLCKKLSKTDMYAETYAIENV